MLSNPIPAPQQHLHPHSVFPSAVSSRSFIPVYCFFSLAPRRKSWGNLQQCSARHFFPIRNCSINAHVSLRLLHNNQRNGIQCVCVVWFLVLPLWLCNSLLKCSLFTWLSNTISNQLNKSSSNHSTRKEFTWMLLAHTKRSHSSFNAFYLFSQLPVSILFFGLHMLWQGLRKFLPSCHVLQPCTLARSRFAWSHHLFFSIFRFVRSTVFKLCFPLINLTGPKSCQSQLWVCLLNPLSLPCSFRQLRELPRQHRRTQLWKVQV